MGRGLDDRCNLATGHPSDHGAGRFGWHNIISGLKLLFQAYSVWLRNAGLRLSWATLDLEGGIIFLDGVCSLNSGPVKLGTCITAVRSSEYQCVKDRTLY